MIVGDPTQWTDLLGSCNTQMMRFNSRYWDAGSEAIDAFTG